LQALDGVKTGPRFTRIAQLLSTRPRAVLVF
jgi:hypothetical protein